MYSMLQHPMSIHTFCPQVSCTAAPLHFLGLSQLGHDSIHTNVCMHVANVVGGGGGEVVNNIKCNIFIPE